MGRLLKLLLAIAGVGLFGLIPFWTVTVVPAWRLTVVDQNGKPRGGVEVRQHWDHYSFDGSGIDPAIGGEENRLSDANGNVGFTEKSFKASALTIALAKIGTPLRWINPHSSEGPSVYFICLNVRCHTLPTYRGESRELDAQIVVEE